MCRREVGSERDGPAQDGFGIDASPLPSKHEGQIEARLDVIGTQIDRLPVGRLGLPVSSLPRPGRRPLIDRLEITHTGIVRRRSKMLVDQGTVDA